MSSDIDICNLALSHIGEESGVTSIDPPEGSAQSERCAIFYPIALRFLLTQQAWSFATKQKTLTEYAQNPRTQWQHCYAMPADCIRLVRLFNVEIPDFPPERLERFGNFETGQNDIGQMCIYTNIADCTALYVSDQVTTSDFPPSFDLALSWKLASMLAGSIATGQDGQALTQSCDKMMTMYLQEAQLHDARFNAANFRNTLPSFIVGRW